VLDFGLARMEPESPDATSLAADDLPTVSLATHPGMVLGTPSYMSPEQVRGQQIDARTDIFSLGCVLYEMIAGCRAFAGDTPADTLTAILREEPTSVLEKHTGVVPELDRAVSRCLEKQPDQRFQSAADLAFTLRSILADSTVVGARRRKRSWHVGITAAGIVAVVVLGGAFMAWWRTDATSHEARGTTDPAAKLPLSNETQHATPSPSATTLAILPFANDAGDPELDYLSDGITESLINTFSRVAELRVIPRSTVFRLYRSGDDPIAVAKGMSATVLLTGRVRKWADRLAIQVDLTDVAENRQLWGERYERNFTDLLAIERDITQEIASGLRLRLGREDESRLNRGSTKDTEAYRLYLQGRYFWNKRTVPDLRKAITYFKEAIARDADYASAWAGLADVHMTLPFYSDAPTSVEIPKARKAAEEALRIDVNLAEAHTTLAYALALYDWSWAASEQEFRRALELDPKYTTALKWFSDVLSIMGRQDEALTMANRAAELDPLSPNNQTIVGLRLWTRGADQEALARFDKALELDARFPLALKHKSWLCWTNGDMEEFFAARAALEQVSADVDVPASSLRQAYATGGRAAVLKMLLASDQAKRFPVDRARWHVSQGSLDAAFVDLEQAFDQRVVWLPFISHYPDMAPLRADPRYYKLRARLGLPASP